MKRAIVVLGLGFGDEGKGSIVDHLVRSEGAELVVRFNGGAQAAHSVVAPDGRAHTFHQFGSGTLAGARTYLTSHMLVNPLALLLEAQELQALGVEAPFSLLSISPHATVTTPFHMALNRLRELSRGRDRVGTCGFGIAETRRDQLAGTHLRFRELSSPSLARRLRRHRDAKLTAASKLGNARRGDDEWEAAWRTLTDAEPLEDTIEAFKAVEELVTQGEPPSTAVTIFEGAQGVLLDEVYGFQPYGTWSDCTGRDAYGVVEADETITLGVLRAYLTRHGPGPFPTEAPEMELHDERNPTNPWQGELRFGWPDLELARYAAECAKFDALAVTCLDHTADMPLMRIAVEHRIDQPFPPSLTGCMFAARPVYEPILPEEVPERLADEMGVPLVITSSGPSALEKQTLRPLTMSAILSA